MLRGTVRGTVADLRHEIVIWQRTAASLSSYTKEEDYVRETLMKKVRRLLFDLKKKLLTGRLARFISSKVRRMSMGIKEVQSVTLESMTHNK